MNDTLIKRNLDKLVETLVEKLENSGVKIQEDDIKEIKSILFEQAVELSSIKTPLWRSKDILTTLSEQYGIKKSVRNKRMEDIERSLETIKEKLLHVDISKMNL